MADLKNLLPVIDLTLLAEQLRERAEGFSRMLTGGVEGLVQRIRETKKSLDELPASTQQLFDQALHFFTAEGQMEEYPGGRNSATFQVGGSQFYLGETICNAREHRQRKVRVFCIVVARDEPEARAAEPPAPLVY